MLTKSFPSKNLLQGSLYSRSPPSSPPRRRRPRRRRPYANRRRQYLRRRYGQQGHMASEFKKNYEVRKCAYAGRVVRWRTHYRLVILQCAVLMWPTLCFHHRNFTKRTERIASLRWLRTGGATGCQACSTMVSLTRFSNESSSPLHSPPTSRLILHLIRFAARGPGSRHVGRVGSRKVYRDREAVQQCRQVRRGGEGGCPKT